MLLNPVKVCCANQENNLSGLPVRQREDNCRMTKTISIAIVGFVLMLSAQQVFAEDHDECVKKCEAGIGD